MILSQYTSRRLRIGRIFVKIWYAKDSEEMYGIKELVNFSFWINTVNSEIFAIILF